MQLLWRISGDDRGDGNSIDLNHVYNTEKWILLLTVTQ